MYRDFAEGDAAGVCRAMSKAVRREIAANVLDERPAPATTCEASMTKFVEAASASGIRENSLGVTVASVDVKGSNATATISLNGRSGGVRLIREQGQWRFGDTPLGQPQ